MMAPALTGSTTTATSSRRSSTSSISLPFATPPTSPKSATSRIPKPSSSSSLSSSARVSSGKARSRSVSNGAGNGSPIAYRADRLVLPSVSPAPSSSSTPNGRRPSLPSSRSEGKDRLVSPSGVAGPSHVPVPRVPSTVQGLGLVGSAAATKIPAAGPSGYSSSPTYTAPPGAREWNRSSPSPAATMQRVTSAEGSARTAVSTNASGPRRQRSASSLPRRTTASPHMPVPGRLPSNATPLPRDAPTIAVSQASPARSHSRPSSNPSHSSSSPHAEQASSSSTTPHRTPRRQQRSRGSTPQPSHASSSPSGNGGNARNIPGDRPHHTKVNGVGYRQSSTPRSSAPASRATSRESSPSRSKGRQRSAQGQAHASLRRQRGESASGPSSRRGSAQDDARSVPLSTTPTASSSRSRIPRREDASPSRLMMASREVTEPPPRLTASSPPSRVASDSQGFGTESSHNYSTPPPPSGLPRRGGSSGRQSGRQPKTPQPSPTPNSPMLSTGPPPPPMSNRRLSVPPQARQPAVPNSTPPVPAKSPLRALNVSVSSSAVASKRQSRAVVASKAPLTSPVPPVPPLPDGLCPAPESSTPLAHPASPREEASSPTALEDVRTPRPSVSAPRTDGPQGSPLAALASLSVADNAVSLNSGPPSDSGGDTTTGSTNGGLTIPPRASSFASSPEQLPWSHSSRDAGSVAATHGHSDYHAQGATAFPEPLAETARALAPYSSLGDAHEVLLASPDQAKARLSVSTSSTSAPVTPAPSIPGRSMQLGDSRPTSEVETTSSGDFPSTYSPDSAPPSAPASSVNLWAVGARYESPADETGPAMHVRGANDHQETLIDGVLWGQKRNSSLQLPPPSKGDNPTTPVTNTFVDKDLPATPRTPRTPKSPKTPKTPKTAQRPGQHPTMRSPSMPQIGVKRTQNGKVVEVEAPLGSPSFPRSNTGPVGVGLQPPMLSPRPQDGSARPQSMLIASTPVTRSPSPQHMSRRSHLLREIAHTERTHATDLALIRDAYIGSFFRPDSGFQLGSEASTPPMDSSRHSRRSSAYGSPMEELGRRTSAQQSDMPRRTSGHDGGLRTSGYQVDGPMRRTSGHERRASGADSAWSNTWSGIMSPVIKSPRTDMGGSSVDLSYSASGAASSSTSLLPSPKVPSTPSSMSGVARFGAGMVRPLSQADIKTIFLNIGAMAAVSDTLATELEAALGNAEDETATPGGGSGTDRVGEVFLKTLPRLRPLYTYYCSRQAQASARLQELQNDPSYSAHLHECWAKVKAHTHAWNLDSMLIKPVQRVTKYPLLFEDLLSCTTPAHPDYFAIRQAAEGAKSLALEVDEAKRRKDVISNVMNGRSSVIGGRSSSSVNLVKDPKRAGGGRLLGRFKKDKAPSGHDQNAILHITPYAQSQLKDLAKRLSDCERNVRRLLVELPDWCEAARLLLRQKMEINIYFLKWYALGRRVTNDDRIEKVARFSGVLDNILTGAWEELNQTVRNSILVNLEKLRETTKNPLAIIAKLDEKSDVYSRYVAHRQAKKSIDKVLLQEANEYVTVHSQLLEELPAFLEGFTRIYEMSLGAFVGAQKKYFETLRDTLALFSAQYLTEPMEMSMVGNTYKEVRMDVSTPRGIHKAWLERHREPNNIMKSLQITGGDGARDAQMRANNLNAGHVSRASGGSSGSAPSSRRFTASSRPPSHRKMPSFDARSSALRNTPTGTASQHSSMEPPSSASNPRRRSISLNVDTPPGSTGPELRPDSGSIFGSLIRRASHRERRRESSTSLLDSRSGSVSGSSSNPSARSTMMMKRPSLRREKSTSARSSAAQSHSEENDRLSFGLPRIPTTNDKFLFDNLSIDSRKNEPVYESPVTYERQDIGLSALGLGNTTPPSDAYYNKRTPPDGYFLQPPREPHSEDATPETYTTPMGMDEPDAGETWRNARVLYSCCAVADFDPIELGDLRFNGLRFLPLLAGDMVDVFHEIGRVAELRDFPYSQAGVDNDGAVIARSENGLIGVAMCSFLEPLRS